MNLTPAQSAAADAVILCQGRTGCETELAEAGILVSQNRVFVMGKYEDQPGVQNLYAPVSKGFRPFLGQMVNGEVWPTSTPSNMQRLGIIVAAE